MKRIIPFGDRVLVKRQKTKEHRTEGKIIFTEATDNQDTDIATVRFVPDLTFTDQKLIENAESIIEGLSKRAGEDSEALKALLNLNHYLKLKSLQPGDKIMMGKYVGTDFKDSAIKEDLTMCRIDDIVGIVKEV